MVDLCAAPGSWSQVLSKRLKLVSNSVIVVTLSIGRNMKVA